MLLSSGCTRIYYAPTTQNVPLLTEANEIRMLGGISGGDEYGVYDFQVSYSPVHISTGFLPPF